MHRTYALALGCGPVACHGGAINEIGGARSHAVRSVGDAESRGVAGVRGAREEGVCRARLDDVSKSTA